MILSDTGVSGEGGLRRILSHFLLSFRRPPLIYLGKRGGIYVWTLQKKEQ